MQQAQSREWRAAAVWAVAVAGHLLLVMAFLSANRSAARRLAAASSEPLLVLIDIPSRPSTPQQSLTRDESDARARRQVPQAASVAPVASAAPAASVAPAVQPRAAVHIDWQRESELVGKRVGAAAATPTVSSFTPPPVASTQVCEKPKQHPPWNRELKRAGFIGALPYVRVGKRCLVGLPFFGCAIGHLPEPDDQLFTDMGAVDRSRSSVPEFPGCLPPPAPVELADPAAVAAPVSAAPASAAPR
jgi:hypothetical protein